MTGGNVDLQRTDGVATLTINRPAALNALDAETLDGIADAVARIDGDSEVRAVVVTGAGDKAFVAGADIAAMESMGSLEGRRFSQKGQGVFRRLELLAQPVIAAVGGFALGGGMELALACDLIVASERARFGQPEINLGITPGFGGTQRLARRVGIARARDLIYSGRTVKAAEAFSMGLVNRVVSPDRLAADAHGWATELAAKAPVALQLAKAMINTGADLDLENACRYESEGFGLCFGTEDRREGMRAFLEKRDAKFSGK